MCRVQRRITKAFEVFEYYTNNQWDFVNTHIVNARDKLNSREYKNYKINADGLDIEMYFEDCIRSARVHILKEMPETLPAARRHLRM
jgi:fatty acyl-CoA reductase